MVHFEQIPVKENPFVVGVIADTHIPDRVDALHPFLLEKLLSLGVHEIWHAGDISIPSVLTVLGSTATVRAVSGNRDLLLRRKIHTSLHLEIYGTRITLTHGHLNPRIYWTDKFDYLTQGYAFARYQERFDRFFPDSQVIVFGHTHHPENRWINERLYLNPGSVSKGGYLHPEPSFALLRFYKDGRIEADLFPLTGAKIKNKKWEIINIA